MPRLSVLAAALGFLVAGCGSSSSSPSPTIAVSTNTFTAALSPSSEVPPVTNAEASGSGTVTVTMLSTKDSAGNVAGATMTFVVNLSGFPAGTPINLAHIHPGASGELGSPLVNLALASGEVVLASGSGSFTKSSIGVDAAVAQRILTTPANYYFNLHSTLNPGGVVRGQLVKVS